MTHVLDLAAWSCPKFCISLSLNSKREQGMPGARCTRGLVCKVAQRNAHTSIQVQRRLSGIPCAMVLRLMPRSPRRRIRLVTVTAGLMADRSGWIASATGSLAPATGVGTTRFCRTQQTPFVLALLLAHGNRPANKPARQRCRVHRIPSHVRDDGQRPSWGMRWRKLVELICPSRLGKNDCLAG